jgi:branched-chain amino acid transport system permease protein
MLLLQQFVNGLALSGVYTLVAVSFTLTIGVLNFLNFTIPATFMLAGMTTWALQRAGQGWLVGILGGLIVASLSMLAVERFSLQSLKVRRGDATEHALPLVSSLGFLIVFQNLALIAWGSDGQRLAPIAADTSARIGGLLVAIPQLFSLLVAIAGVAVVKAVLDHTRFGRALRCIAENPMAATLMGIEVRTVVPLMFIIAGLVAGIAGVLFSVSYLQVSVGMGDEVGTKAIAAMVIGGMGNIWGAIVGGLVVGMLEVLSINYFRAEAVNVVVWGVLLVILFVRPTGLIGQPSVGKGKF